MDLKDSSFHSATNDYGQFFARNSFHAAAPVLSASMDTGSMDSPSLTDGRTQNVESLGDDLESPDFAGLVCAVHHHYGIIMMLHELIYSCAVPKRRNVGQDLVVQRKVGEACDTSA